jgi:predicted DNA-binding protein (MmcQ/YjbR family)
MAVFEHHARQALVFRVRGRSFAWYLDNHHGDGRMALWCKAAAGEQEVRVSDGPDRYFVPPYVGRRGWVGLRLDTKIDWAEVAELVEDSYRMIAPSRLTALLE